MFPRLGNSMSKCLGPMCRFARMDGDDDDGSVGGEDDALWSRNLEKHSYGEFSFAIVKANLNLEDQSQVESGPDATFVGVYDGHGGNQAARHVCDHLYPNFLNVAQESRAISENIIRRAVSETEASFRAVVEQRFGNEPLIAAVGSCCLVGAVWRGMLFVANLGDSRAVMGSLDQRNRMVAEQLTKDHNASLEEVREELKMLHPDDPQILILREGVWRIKGIIQISRSIGDWYLKTPDFALDDSFPRFHLPEPLVHAVLTADPDTSTRILRPQNKFIIFASDGLWEFLKNQEAVEIVQRKPREGIARRLIKAALKKAAREKRIQYSDIRNLNPGQRRNIHDDITVVVLFIDHQRNEDTPRPNLSVRGFTETEPGAEITAPLVF